MDLALTSSPRTFFIMIMSENNLIKTENQYRSIFCQFSFIRIFRLPFLSVEKLSNLLHWFEFEKNSEEMRSVRLIGVISFVCLDLRPSVFISLKEKCNKNSLSRFCENIFHNFMFDKAIITFILRIWFSQCWAAILASSPMIWLTCDQYQYVIDWDVELHWCWR
jgi:hypothetical protein